MHHRFAGAVAQPAGVIALCAAFASSHMGRTKGWWFRRRLTALRRMKHQNLPKSGDESPHSKSASLMLRNPQDERPITHVHPPQRGSPMSAQGKWNVALGRKPHISDSSPKGAAPIPDRPYSREIGPPRWGFL